MSKYFKNNKSEGDEEYKSVERYRVKPRSYSCKPDIGPSGDHRTIETIPFERRPNFKVNMWLNNIGSGSSQNSCSNELYRLDEDHLESINFVRRKLNMVELKDLDEEPCGIENLEETTYLGPCVRNEGCSVCREAGDMETSPKTRPSLSSISEITKISPTSTTSAVRYKPPEKKQCMHSVEPTTSSSVKGHRTKRPKNAVIEVPGLNLNVECNENKSVQCTSKDTDCTSHSTEVAKPQCYQQGDNADLMEHLYIEPEIILKQPDKAPKRANSNCITFTPIKDEDSTCSEKSNKKEFFDEIVSNCSFSMRNPAPLVPSHDSFFKPRKRQRKRRFKKRGKSVVEAVKLDKSSIEVRRTFPSTTETSEAFEHRETEEIPVITSKKFDNTLMASLAVPSKLIKPIKLPLVTKLSEMIHGITSKEVKSREIQECAFEDDITSVKSSLKHRDTHVRVGTEYNSYREAAEDLLSINERRTDDMKQKEVCLHKNLRQKSSNKYATKKRQSVDYDFYSMDLPQRGTCDVLDLNQETEEESDSGCLRAIENCCCVRWIFKRRRSDFFSN